MKEWMQHILTRKNGDPMDGGSLEIMVCWLEVDKRVKEGSIITLQKCGNKRWRVEKQFKDLRTNHPPRQDWKVGGLF